MKVRRNAKFVGRDYNDERETVEIVTQLSIDRISRLESICKIWNGPIVATILDENRAGQENQRTTQHIVQELEAKVILRNGFHSLRTIIVTRDKTPHSLPYPINSLRNIALQNASSEYVFLLDVDCIPSSDLFESLVGTSELKNSLRNICIQYFGAIVVPCFEPSEPTSFNPLEPFSSQQVRSLAALTSPSLRQFAVSEFERGHGATNYPKWLHAKDQSENAFHQYYQIEYQEGFEPFLILARALAPLYCEELVGYGRNKILQIYHMFRLGISFWVTALGCIIHTPHSLSSDRIQLLGNSDCSERPEDGRLEEVKATYARYRERATVYCASWALLDGNSSPTKFPFSDFSTFSFPSRTQKIRTSRSLFRQRQSSSDVCGSSIASWPTNEYYSGLIRTFFSTSLRNKSCYRCDQRQIDSIRSDYPEGFLANLCSVHMVYKQPIFTRLRFDHTHCS
jgi:hypothetical protein